MVGPRGRSLECSGGGRTTKCQGRDRWANRRPTCSPLLLIFLIALHLHRARPPGRPLGVCTQSDLFSLLCSPFPFQYKHDWRSPIIPQTDFLDSHSSRQPASGTFLFLLYLSADHLRLCVSYTFPRFILSTRIDHYEAQSTINHPTFDSARGDKRCLCHWPTP